jgi:hypothetical protein
MTPEIARRMPANSRGFRVARVTHTEAQLRDALTRAWETWKTVAPTTPLLGAGLDIMENRVLFEVDPVDFYGSGGQDIMRVQLPVDQKSHLIYGSSLVYGGSGACPITGQAACASRGTSDVVDCGTVRTTWTSWVSNTHHEKSKNHSGALSRGHGPSTDWLRGANRSRLLECQ